MRPAPIWGVILLAGCGYSFGTVYQVEELTVSFFDNLSERRHHEMELTRQVVQELRYAGIRIKPGAEMELEGEITRLTLPALAESGSDELLVGGFRVEAKVRLIEASSRKVRWEKSVSASDSFTDLRGKPVEAARQEAFRRLGAAIVSILESDW